MTEERQHHLEAGLNRLKSMLSDLMENVRSSLVKAIEALDLLDGKAAREIVENDETIDGLQRKIDTETCNYIARFQPLADDLRYVITMIKLATDLERIGDLAVNISEVAIKYEGNTLPKPLIHIKKMTGIVEKMIDDVITAYYNKDIELAKKVWLMDEEVDKSYSYIKEEIVGKLMERPDELVMHQYMDLLLVARFLERAGDHTTNVSEEIYYIVNGRLLKEEMKN